ncbi:MAG: ATP synthase F1 subunit delta [Gemmatimonadota bacterium]
MTSETIARNYAATLFDLAQRHEGLEAFSDGLGAVVGLLDQNPRFRVFLETPRIADQDKKDLLKKVFGGVLPKALLNFLQVTVDKRRQRLLGLIGGEFNALLDDHLGRVHVTVTVARSMEAGALEEISGKLSALLGQEAIPHLRVKPEILGGVHLKTGDTVYDGTLRRRIKQLRKQLVTAELPDTATGGGAS